MKQFITIPVNHFHLFLFQSGIWYVINKGLNKAVTTISSSEWCLEQLFFGGMRTGDVSKNRTEYDYDKYYDQLHFIKAWNVLWINLSCVLACRFGRKPMLLVSYISGMAFTLASIFSSSFIMFAVLRFLVDHNHRHHYCLKLCSVRPLSQVLRLWLNVNINKVNGLLYMHVFLQMWSGWTFQHRRLVCITGSMAWAVGSTSLSFLRSVSETGDGWQRPSRHLYCYPQSSGGNGPGTFCQNESIKVRMSYRAYVSDCSGFQSQLGGW